MLQGLLISPHSWLCTVEFCAYFPAGIAFRSLQDLNANTCVLGGRNLFPHKLGTFMELCEIRFFLLEIANRFHLTHHKVIWWVYLSVCWEFCAVCLQCCDVCWLLPTHAWCSVQYLHAFNNWKHWMSSVLILINLWLSEMKVLLAFLIFCEVFEFGVLTPGYALTLSCTRLLNPF